MNSPHATLNQARHAAPESLGQARLDAPTVPLPVMGSTAPTVRGATAVAAPAATRGSPWRRRGILAATSVAALAAASGGAFVLGAHSVPDTSTVSPPAVAPSVAGAAAPVRATPAVAAPVATKVAKPHKATATTTAKPASPTPASSYRSAHHMKGDTGAGCGQRAVTAGVFNAACSEYQGYLDPGVAAGRAPSSGDIQRQACLDGELPGVKPSQC